MNLLIQIWVSEYLHDSSAPCLIICVLYRPEPDVQLGTSWAAPPSWSHHLRVLRGAGQSAGSPRWAGVWEGGEEHVHHGFDGGAKQAEGAEGKQQTSASWQGPESTGSRDAAHQRREHGTHWEDRGDASQGEREGGGNGLVFLKHYTWICMCVCVLWPVVTNKSHIAFCHCTKTWWCQQSIIVAVKHGRQCLVHCKWATAHWCRALLFLPLLV